MILIAIWARTKQNMEITRWRGQKNFHAVRMIQPPMGGEDSARSKEKSSRETRGKEKHG
jgi:hypothetical protein